MAPLIGSWIRVYPPDGALDTLVLHADGTVSGSVASFYAPSYRIELWKVGDPNMPGGLCVGEGGRRWVCQAFRLAGDTLSLANLQNTVFLRAPADGRGSRLTAWESPRGPIAPPAPGDSVRATPDADRR